MRPEIFTEHVLLRLGPVPLTRTMVTSAATSVLLALLFAAVARAVVRRLGSTVPAGEGPPGLVVIGSDLGVCGSYNARVVEAAVRRRAELGTGPTFCVGRRAASLLARWRIAAAATYDAPTGVRGITGLLLRLAEDLLASYAADRLSSIEVVSSRFAGVGSAQPAVARLLPLESAPAAAARGSRYVSPEHFASAAARELLYITLYDLLLGALASEHGARLLATQSAERWLEGRTESLRRLLAAMRREATTQETIEIAAAARLR